jgi:hypothetical protein
VSKDNVFSLNRFRTKGWSEQAAKAAKEAATPEVKKATPNRRPRAETTFVRLPYQQITQLYGCLSVAAFHVMVELDHQHFKNRGKNPPGLGSGRWKNRAHKTVESYRMLDVNQLSEKGWLRPDRSSTCRWIVGNAPALDRRLLRELRCGRRAPPAPDRDARF